MNETKQSIVSPLAAWLSVFVSLTTLGVLIWRGGAIANQVAVDSARILAIEHEGSSGLRAHELMDDVRVAGHDKRLANLERAMDGMVQMREDIREIRTRLEMMYKQTSGTTLPPKTTGGGPW